MSYLVDEGGELLNAVTFIIFGAAILGPALDDLGWEVIVYAVLSLTVVRMLPGLRSRCSAAARAAQRSRSWAGSARVGSRRSSSP